MTVRTLECPSGCDTGLLEREHSIVIKAINDKMIEVPTTEYICTGCGWNADWTSGWGKGFFEIRHNPRGFLEEYLAEIYELA